MSVTKKRPETISANVTLKGQGETLKFGAVFNNCKQSELIAFVTENPGATLKHIMFMVKELEGVEYELTEAGLDEWEDDRPGTMMGLIEAFHDARRFSKAKN